MCLLFALKSEQKCRKRDPIDRAITYNKIDLSVLELLIIPHCEIWNEVKIRSFGKLVH